MKMRLCLLILFAMIGFASAATIPAGTTIIARTTDPISTHERIGGTFHAALEHDVVVKGKPVLRAGTPVIGVVEGSLRAPSKGAVIVNLKSISVNGRQVPVRTTDAYRLPPRFSTKRGVAVSGRETNYPHQTRIGFHLAEPVSF